jgi:hypothetical protein
LRKTTTPGVIVACAASAYRRIDNYHVGRNEPCAGVGLAEGFAAHSARVQASTIYGRRLAFFGRNMSAHDDRIARLQQLLDTLAQMRKQASDLSRMAEELHTEAEESIRLVAETARDTGGRKRSSLRRPLAKTGKRKRR